MLLLAGPTSGRRHATRDTRPELGERAGWAYLLHPLKLLCAHPGRHLLESLLLVNTQLALLGDRLLPVNAKRKMRIKGSGSRFEVELSQAVSLFPPVCSSQLEVRSDLNDDDWLCTYLSSSAIFSSLRVFSMSLMASSFFRFSTRASHDAVLRPAGRFERLHRPHTIDDERSVIMSAKSWLRPAQAMRADCTDTVAVFGCFQNLPDTRPPADWLRAIVEGGLEVEVEASTARPTEDVISAWAGMTGGPRGE